MNKSIQITLDINGDDVYIMKYPETVNLTLELSRSETWWGVFLSVVETFQAIKEDREYLLNAFDEWKTSGFDANFFINIDIAVLEFSEYVSIYQGIALPEYSDNTLYFKTKFSEVGNVQKFLDRSIESVFDMEEDGQTLTFDSLQGVYNVINAIDNYYGQIFMNRLNMTEGSGTFRIINFSGGGSNYTFPKSFINNNNETEYNFIGTKSVPTEKSYFLNDDDNINVPKQSKVTIKINPGTSSNHLLPYAKDGSSYVGADTFQLNLLLNNSGIITDKFEYTLSGSGDDTYFQLTKNEVEIENSSSRTAFVSIQTNTTGIEELDNQCVGYRRTGGFSGYILTIEYENINNSVDFLPISTILNGLFDVDIQNTDLLRNFNAYGFLPFDGAIAGSSTSTLTLNTADFLEEISKALSVGVTVNPDNQKLLIKPINEMFSDEELFIIQDDVISSFEISLNEFLKVGKLTLGAADRKFNYSYDRIGQNIQTVYTARNAFSGSLDLSLSRYKCQMFDFIDTYKDDVFGLYSDEDKNDGEFTLFQNVAIRNSGDYRAYRFNNINSGHTAVSQVCAWSWLLQTISPQGFDSESEANYVQIESPIEAQDTVSLTNNIEPSNRAFFQLPQRITLRKFNAVFKLTTEQYNRIINNRDGYLTLIYKGVTYKGYINNLSLQVGKNMIATVELLERFEQ